MTQTTFTQEQITKSKLIAENTLKIQTEIKPATDGANLMFYGFDKISGTRLYSLYKSFDEKFKPIVVIRYSYTD